MKKIFKLALVAFAAALAFAACQKPGTPQSETIALKGIALNKPAAELEIGATETLTVTYDPSNATEKPEVEWSSSAPAVATVDKGVVSAVAAGEATITAKAGTFTATCKITVKAGEEPTPEIIAIDGDFSDWAEIEAVGKGTHSAFKVTFDEKNLYVYTKRIKGEGEAATGYEEMWGHASEGYIYLALDLDKNPETGDMLWTNGPFEFVGYHYPFGGSAESPAINEKPGANTSCAPSTASTKNIFCKGKIGTDEVEIEYSIPLADLPALPETPFIVYSWGSLGLDKVEYHVGEPQPSLFESHYGIDWLNVDSVEGEVEEEMDAVKSIRATADKEKVYVCVEVAKDALIWETHTYADRSYFCFSDGTEGGSRWIQTESQKVEGWLMYNAEPYYINWNNAVVDHKAYTAVVEDVVYFEVAILRSEVDALKGEKGYVGFFMTDTYNDSSTQGTRAEIGYAPAKGESMLEVTLPAM